MVPEAPLEQTDHSSVPTGDGWFVVNVRDAQLLDGGELDLYAPRQPGSRRE